MLLPLSSQHAYRISFDILADAAAPLTIALNGEPIGTCRLDSDQKCAAEIRQGRGRDGVNAVTLGRAGRFTFEGARILRRE